MYCIIMSHHVFLYNELKIKQLTIIQIKIQIINKNTVTFKSQLQTDFDLIRINTQYMSF